MALLNYTTTIAAENSVGEIMRLLPKARAQAILTEYDGAEEIKALSFKIPTQAGIVTFHLPADIASVQLVLNKQASAGKIPRRYINDGAQARRIAWRILKDWLEAQLALIETGLAKAEQVLLPYAQVPETGKTVYETYAERSGFNGLALPPAPPKGER